MHESTPDCFSPPAEAALYVFEGPDGVGKTTLAAKLRDYLLRQQLQSELLSFPGQEPGTLGEHIYRLYHNPSSFGIGSIHITTEQILFTAAHAEVIESRILPTLNKGINVVLDRYWWSTWVYAKYGGLDTRVLDLLLKLELAIWKNVAPTCTFFVRRTHPLKSELQMEKWQSLVSLYEELHLRQSKSENVVDVDNSNDLERTFELVVAAINRQNAPHS